VKTCLADEAMKYVAIAFYFEVCSPFARNLEILLISSVANFAGVAMVSVEVRD